MDQRTTEWHELRKSKIGASDAPIVCGVSPYKTAYTLWLEKTDRKEKDPVNSAMERGIALEPILRSKYEQKVDDPFMPKVVIHPEHEFMMASLDGINLDGDTILEIKTCGKNVFSQVHKNGVLKEHMYQAQMQLMCCPEVKNLVFYYANVDWEGKIIGELFIDVERDQDIQDEILKRSTEFYEHMIYDTPPPAEESDFLLIEDDEHFESCANRWKKAKEALKQAEEEEKEARQELLDATDDSSCIGYGVKLSKFYDQRTDYKSACLDSGIDLSNYKKERKVRWRVTENEY